MKFTNRATGHDMFRGASVVIYNDEDVPAYIVGYHRGVDFTLSKLRFAGHAIKVEIVNHAITPLILDRSNDVTPQ